MKYEEIVKNIVGLLGGSDNIVNAYHCISRLRFEVKDISKVQLPEIGKLNKVMGTNIVDQQVQIIIGTDVNNAYAEFVKEYPELENTAVRQKDDRRSKNPVMVFVTTLASICAAFLPALAGAGMLKALVSIIQIYGWMDTTGSTFTILNAMGDGLFYFLPFFVGLSAAEKFKMNKFVALAIIAAIQHPQITAMLATDEAVFFNIPVKALNYSSTIIHPLVAIFVASFIHKFAEKKVPSVIRLFASPMITIMLSVPLTLIVIGPIAQILAVWMGKIVELVLATGPIGGAVLGFIWPAVVMTGMHGTTYPITLNSMMVNGYDFLWPIKNLNNMSLAGASWGVALKTKNKKLRGVAFSTGLTSFIGVCEPALFGITLPKKKPFLAAMIANGIGGAVMGIFRVTCNIVPTTGGVFGFVYYIGKTFPFAMIAIAVSIVSAVVITYVLGFEDDPE